MAVSDFLLEILRCPQCISEVRLDGDSLVCTNGECRRVYRVEDDIPIMLIDEATVLEPDAWQQRIDALPAARPASPDQAVSNEQGSPESS